VKKSLDLYLYLIYEVLDNDPNRYMYLNLIIKFDLLLFK
jgi:hypothetical protein